jgi:putative spermidine/putrescine transport system substrate-binding protein
LFRLAGAIAIAALAPSCQALGEVSLRVTGVKGLIPGPVLANLRKILFANGKLVLTGKKNVAEVFQQLQQWQGVEQRTETEQAIAQWVCLSDAWLLAAIQRSLISPLAVEDTAVWNTIPERWRSLLRRNQAGLVTATGDVWAMPYRWGHLMVVYPRRIMARLGWQPTQWSDLWHPDLAGRLALPNHPRQVLGLVLQSLGYSANDPDPGKHTEVMEALTKLAPQVKTYASTNYLEALIMEDVWLAVGWSTDIRPVLRNYPQLVALTPAPATLLTADVWVKPKQLEAAEAIPLSPLEEQWVSYWWRSDVAPPLSLFSEGLAPGLLSPTPDTAIEVPREKILLPTTAILDQSEFLQPLEPDAVSRYEALWRQLRGSK